MYTGILICDQGCLKLIIKTKLWNRGIVSILRKIIKISYKTK